MEKSFDAFDITRLIFIQKGAKSDEAENDYYVVRMETTYYPDCIVVRRVKYGLTSTFCGRYSDIEAAANWLEAQGYELAPV